MTSKPKDLREQLEVKRSTMGKGTSAGLGLFTTKPIKKGAFIIEYEGPLLTQDQADRKGGKYLFALGSKWTIDGSSRNNLARYINHSCVQENCETVQYDKRIKIKATRNIKAGEELVYDYGKEYFDEYIGDKCNCPKHRKKSKTKSRSSKKTTTGLAAKKKK